MSMIIYRRLKPTRSTPERYHLASERLGSTRPLCGKYLRLDWWEKVLTADPPAGVMLCGKCKERRDRETSA